MRTTDDYSDWLVFNKPLPEQDAIIVPIPKQRHTSQRLKVSKELDKKLELEQAIQGLIEACVYICDLASEIADGNHKAD